MLDIVSIHVTGRYLLAGAGLPAFIIVAVALAVRRPALPVGADFVPQARRRVGQLMVPWAAWSSFFALHLLLKASLSPRFAAADLFYPWMFASGPSIHLWFLPFIVVAEAAVLAVLCPLRRLPTPAVIAGALALACAAVWGAAWVYDARDPLYDPLGELAQTDRAQRAAFFGWMIHKSWLLGAASICLGVVVGRTLSLRGSATPRRLLLAAGLVFFGLTFAFEQLRLPLPDSFYWLWRRQFLALLLVAVAVQRTGPTPGFIKHAAVLTLGVYLLHSWVDERLAALLQRLYDTSAWRVLWPVGSILHDRHGRVAAVWLITAAFVAVLRRTKLRRIL